MYITLLESYGDQVICTVMITEKEWERSGRPANVQEYEVWRMNHDPRIRARFEAEESERRDIEESDRCRGVELGEG